MTRVLILGGTSDANALARELVAAEIDAVYSYAGRTQVPVRQPLPVRTGGFGGSEGLAQYIRAQGITHVIDATHPFAAVVSQNALSACAATETPLIALVRKAWMPAPGDQWISVPDIQSAVTALPDESTSVFLAIGRQHLEPFAALPQHRYLLRFVDKPLGVLPLPNAKLIVARGPFTHEGEHELMRSEAVDWLVTRNSGGDGARAKIDVARRLRLPVVMIERPQMPERLCVANVEDVMAWLCHETCLGA